MARTSRGECPSCRLERCACRSGLTVITAAGADLATALDVARLYLERRGWSGELQGYRRRRARIGIMGYRAWDLQYRLRPVPRIERIG